MRSKKRPISGDNSPAANMPQYGVRLNQVDGVIFVSRSLTERKFVQVLHLFRFHNFVVVRDTFGGQCDLQRLCASFDIEVIDGEV